MNTALLRRTLAHIEANPAEWYQPNWRCGTGMCFAGWAVTLAGGKWLTRPGEFGERFLEPTDGDPQQDISKMSDGRRGVHVQLRAVRILGLDEELADRLFCATNSLDDLREIVAELCGEA